MNYKRRNALIKEGISAANDGKTIFDCPYGRCSESAVWWYSGVRQRRAEIEKEAELAAKNDKTDLGRACKECGVCVSKKESVPCSKCGDVCCHKHLYFYVDGNNEAITSNSPGLCGDCYEICHKL